MEYSEEEQKQSKFYTGEEDSAKEEVALEPAALFARPPASKRRTPVDSSKRYLLSHTLPMTPSLN
jgi:hypothetical protein